MKLFSYRKRPVHLGPYPMETLARTDDASLSDVAVGRPLRMAPADDPASIRHAMDDYQSLLDTLRDGPVNPAQAEIPDDPVERANNLKAFGYFLDVSLAGTCLLTDDVRLSDSWRHPRIEEWSGKAKAMQTKPIPPVAEMAWQRISMAQATADRPIDDLTHAIVYAVEYPRDPGLDEQGAGWIQDLQPYRAVLRATEVAVALASYLRLLGFAARVHSATSSDVDLDRLAVLSGIADSDLSNPFIGTRFGLAAVTTDMDIKADRPLAAQSIGRRLASKGPAWWLGTRSHKNAGDVPPYRKRLFKDSEFPVERLKRREEPTTLVDAERIPRVPKRADFFQRTFIGDLGPGPRDASIDGDAVMKYPVGGALTALLNSYSLLQRDDAGETRAAGYDDPQANADLIKATLHFLGADLVGISEAPDWVWYSHQINGQPLAPPHRFAVTTLIDQGHETMEGASGDDWLSAAQSMRAYMRGSLLNGVVTRQLRRLGFPATNHTASDGDVLQPPLVLLAGLGEVSRIGDVVMNPFLGPRLKCGVITTDFPMAVDKPIDFGLQTFCDNCLKCARECPSGAITAGPKVMFNGYEIWRADAEKCTRYRMTNSAGSMCGRCMKTCPWNLEGIFSEGPFRFLATMAPRTARILMKIDDWLGNGDINPIKKWWWDLDGGMMRPAVTPAAVNRRGLNVGLDLKAADQTLACYPADIAPSPYLEPQPLDREQGIKAYDALVTPDEYRRGDPDTLTPKYVAPEGPPPVFPVLVKSKLPASEDGRVLRFELASVSGSPLPPFEAGAHIDVMIAPQFIRQYSLCSDPADTSSYVIGVLREEHGTGGSQRIHQRLMPGKMVMISQPRNHFPLADNAKRSLLLAGGVGVTPLMAMATTLHERGADFELHYKASKQMHAGFVEELESAPWRDRVHCWFSDQNRKDARELVPGYEPGDHLYTCGPSGFMDAVFDEAADKDWPEDALHREYFTAPDDIEYENFDFRLKLAHRGIELDVPAGKSATDVLIEAGIPIDVKCSDGLCGTCVVDYSDGEVEHRDFVLSNAQRETRIALCCSRAAEAGGEIAVDL